MLLFFSKKMKFTKGAGSKYIEDTVDVDVDVVILCPLETK